MRFGWLGIPIIAVLAGACGSSYDPKYTIPADTELKKFEPKDEDDILDEAELEELDEAPAASVAPAPAPAAEPAGASQSPAADATAGPDGGE